ncbi:hypothetical protein A9404_05730 [Halothiobacillus diazotrophicus]|uniref:ESPR domain-containing protein n=1 Tax=Halothiobacillus diazotrophicus TaxID=1860122 RepID=A0A191ZGD6_9GAMM|nr:hypothetical protein [Halothiobacillus diazotrophicus]ANJ66944.1 hypothetical protein A9404_05730 [Halothiobacillus diazotrophicus]
MSPHLSRQIRPRRLILSLGLVLGLLGTTAQADEYDWMLQVLDSSRINGQVGSGASGNMAVNTAAGDGNIQANQRQIGVGGGVVAGPVTPLGVHKPSNVSGGAALDAQTEIGGQAFSHSAGVLGINQVSGAGNAQVNTMSMGGGGSSSSGIRAMGAGIPKPLPNLSGQDTGRRAGHIPDRYRAVIGEGALSGFSGVLQINQVSGIGNMTANHFSISMP